MESPSHLDIDISHGVGAQVRQSLGKTGWLLSCLCGEMENIPEVSPQAFSHG
jgi:hypothetical protein